MRAQRGGTCFRHGAKRGGGGKAESPKTSRSEQAEKGERSSRQLKLREESYKTVGESSTFRELPGFRDDV